MNPVLIHIRPIDKRTGTRVDIRIADGGSADDYAIGGVAWDPACATRPTLSQELASPELDGQVQAGEARFDVLLLRLAHPRPFDLYWQGAPVVIHCAGLIEGSTAVPDLQGHISGQNRNADTGRASLTGKVSTSMIEKPLLTGEFTGGGGIGGDPDKRGVLWPAGFGTQYNIEPVWFDLTRNIGMVDGYGNTLDIFWLGEGLDSFGTAIANYANYAALAAAIDAKAVPPGRWAVSIQPGQPSLVGLGAPAAGIITVHAQFGAGKIGSMMQRIATTHAKVPAINIDAAAFAALDQAVPYPVHYWTDQQRECSDLLSALAQSCNATPLVTFQQKLTVTRAVGGPVSATLDRSGNTEPRVLDWQLAEVAPPYYLLRARTARPAKVLTFDQVNYRDTISDLGLYNPDTVYRDGNIVWLNDASQWLYINATAAAGHAPPPSPTSDEWWQNLKPATKATDILYEDGKSVEDLKPATPGATAGAPAGTTVGGVVKPDGTIEGGVLAEEITRIQGLNGLNILKEILRTDVLEGVTNALKGLTDLENGAIVTQLSKQITDDIKSVAELVDLIAVKRADGLGVVLRANTAVATGDGLELRQLDALIGKVDGYDADITDLKEILIDPTGATLRSTNIMDLNGAITGTVNTLTGEVGEYVIYADIFRLIRPNGGQPQQVFFYGADGIPEMPQVRVGKLIPATGGSTNLPSIVSATSPISGGGISNYRVVLQTTVVTDGPATIFANSALKNDYNDGPKSWAERLLINNQQVFRTYGGQRIDSVALMGGLFLPEAGSYNVRVEFAAEDSSVVVQDRTLFAVAYYGAG